MKWIKSYESFRERENFQNYEVLLEAILNIDKDIEQSLLEIKNDPTSTKVHSKVAQYILDWYDPSNPKDLMKLKYDSISLNQDFNPTQPEKMPNLPLIGKINKSINPQAITSVIGNIVSSIFSQSGNENLERYYVRSLGDAKDKINVSEKSFLTESQYKKILKNFSDEEIKYNKQKRGSDLTKWFIDDLSAANIIDEFSTRLANLIKDRKVVKKLDSNIRIVSGGSKIEKSGKQVVDEFLYWYDKQNSKKVVDSELFKSCMNSGAKNEFMKFYSENTDKVQLIIKTEKIIDEYGNEVEKLVARALLWTLDYSENGFSYYMDRCYAISKDDPENLFSWLRKQEKYKNSNRRTVEFPNDVMIVKLKNVLFRAYPYLDTFKNLFIQYDKKLYLQQSKELDLGQRNQLDIDSILKNDGFISNVVMNKLSLDQNLQPSSYSNNEDANLEDYVDFELTSTNAKRIVKNYSLSGLENKTLIPLVVIQSYNKSLMLLPPNNWLNELKNLLKVKNLLLNGADENQVFQVLELGMISSISEVEDILKENGLKLSDYKRSHQFTYIPMKMVTHSYNSTDQGMEELIGSRFYCYDVIDLLNNNDEISEILTGRKSYGGYFYKIPPQRQTVAISALDYHLLGINVKYPVEDRPLEFNSSYDMVGSSTGFYEEKQLENDVKYVKRKNWHIQNEKFIKAYLKEKNLMTEVNKKLLIYHKALVDDDFCKITKF